MEHGLHPHRHHAHRPFSPFLQHAFSVAFAVVLTVLLLALLFASIRMAR